MENSTENPQVSNQNKDVMENTDFHDSEGHHHDNSNPLDNKKSHPDRGKMRFKHFPEKDSWQNEMSENGVEENGVFKSCLTETKENLMRFAEILYKCTLCTSMPSILTSESSFVSHVTDEHLKKHVSSISCPQCELMFGTEEDLKFHVGFSHADSSLSSVENFNNHCTKSEEKISELPFSRLWSVNKEGCVPKSLDISKYIKKRNGRPALDSCQEANSLNKMNDMECSPKITISHEPENPHKNVPMENRVKLQELTNEIFTKQKDVGSIHMGVDVSHISAIKNVSSTPEFGKYTKLVREGGSIVYFCQVCNWKSQIKVHFAGHCKNKIHQMKVKAAEEQSCADQNDIEKRKQELPLSLVNKSEVPKPRKLEMSKLTENQNFENEEKSLEGVHRMKRVSPVRPNKRKRSSANIVRYYDHNNDWNSSDSNSSNSSYFIPTRENSIEQVTKSDRSQFGIQSHDSFVKQETDLLSPKAAKLSPVQKSQCEYRNKSPPNQFVPSKAVFPEFCVRSASDGSRNSHRQSPAKPTGSALLNQLLSLTPKLSSSLSPTSTSSWLETHENNKIYEDSNIHHTEIPRMISSNLISKRESPSMHCIETSKMQHSENSTKQSQEASCHHFTGLVMSKCSFCHASFESDTLLRFHMEKIHFTNLKDNFQLPKQSDEKEGIGEVNKIIKLKEVIPGLLYSTPHGNVSREQLLQKFSEMTYIPEATQWGPACNKAIRELFPDSSAQRKGKYKKTYYFGISFTEPPNGETEDVSDSEQTPFQSLRDVSYDLDRILQHLHSILEWSGDMTQGVVREDLLSVVAVRLQDSEMQQRGTLCNKAVRGAFPNVKMMRKGKFKTTVYFGVSFKEDVHNLLPESSVSLSPLMMSRRGPKKKFMENETQNRYNTHWNPGNSCIQDQKVNKEYSSLSGLYNTVSKLGSCNSEMEMENVKGTKVGPSNSSSGGSDLFPMTLGGYWPRYDKSLDNPKSRLSTQSVMSKAFPSHMEQQREVTAERLDLSREYCQEKEYISASNFYENERQSKEIVNKSVDRKHYTESAYGNAGYHGKGEMEVSATDIGVTSFHNPSVNPMNKKFEVSSDEDDNDDDCDDDDADDERSASPSIPEGEENLDDPTTKSSLIMRFRRKSSASNGKIYSTF